MDFGPSLAYDRDILVQITFQSDANRRLAGGLLVRLALTISFRTARYRLLAGRLAGVVVCAIALNALAYAQTSPAATPPEAQGTATASAQANAPAAQAPDAAPATSPLGAPPRSARAITEPPPVLDPSHYSIKVHSPYQSLVKGRQLMNETALDLMAELGYKESIASERETRGPKLTSVAETRFFVRSIGNELRSIELDLVRNSSGKYDVFIYGKDRRGETDAPNPDLPKLLPTIVALFDEAESTDRTEDHGPVGQFVFQLSYIQADQAMGMLKALGYSTIEFNKMPGATTWENLYEPIRRGDARLPYVIKFIEGSKMSIMEPNEQPPGSMPMPTAMMGQPSRTAIPDIGGTFLHHMTAGEPEQRLLVVYDHEQPDALETLLNTLRGTIDVPARQVVLSALVVELNSQRARDLGLTFAGGNGRTDSTFNRDSKDVQQPFTFTFDSSRPRTAFEFNATLSALITSGEAEILSNPSVLVIDGRQARIQIGQQVPVVNSTATAAGITSSVDYFPVGIVLNIRPRINEQGTEVTMQVETIVSAVGQNAATNSAVFYAPTIDNRQVQTFVRVADNTPFIVGGLVSSNDSKGRSGVPFLSQIPGLASLFGRVTASNQKKEVIVVLTPHIIPPQRPIFSYVLPKDADLLDSFDLRLFRNAYRIRSEDVHDLAFLDDSDIFQALLARIRSRAEMQPSLRNTEPFTSLLAGRIPGEEILVRRMLWEIVMKLGSAKEIDPARIRLFEGSPDPADPHLQVEHLGDRLSDLARSGKNTLELIFASPAATTEHPFAQPKASVAYESVAAGTAEKLLLSLNTTRPNGLPQQAAIVLGSDKYDDVTPLDALRGVLVLKKLLALNAGVPLTLANFQVGRQVIFPTEEDIRQATHVVDRDTARLFYEVVAYYPAFEREFNRRTREALHEMGFDVER